MAAVFSWSYKKVHRCISSRTRCTACCVLCRALSRKRFSDVRSIRPVVLYVRLYCENGMASGWLVPEGTRISGHSIFTHRKHRTKYNPSAQTYPECNISHIQNSKKKSRFHDAFADPIYIFFLHTHPYFIAYISFTFLLF